MAQMAIKNEANTFTQITTFSQPLRAAAGSAAAPSYSFTDSTDMGMYRIANGILGFAPSGTEQIRLTNVFAQFAGVLRAPDGTNAAPGFAFISDPGTGVQATATSLNLIANGQSIASFTSSSDIFAGVGRSWSGQSDRTAARPAFNFNSDPDTGFYNAGPNSIGFAAGGVSIGTMDSSAFWTANGVSIHGDAAGDAGNPSYAYTNDTDTGVFRVQANIMGFAAGGVRVGSWGQGGFGVDAGVPVFLSLPTTPGIGGSLWNDSGTVKVA
jgi:hypothetical protein